MAWVEAKSYRVAVAVLPPSALTMKKHLNSSSNWTPQIQQKKRSPFAPRPFTNEYSRLSRSPKTDEPAQIGARWDLTKMSWHKSSPNAYSGIPGQPLQAKLTVGAADDPYEREADRVAMRVVDQIHSTGAGQPLTESPEQNASRTRNTTTVRHNTLQPRIQRDIIIFPTIGSQGQGQRFNLRQACDFLSDQLKGDIKFQVVRDMVASNWFGQSTQAFINEAENRSANVEGPTIDDAYVNSVAQLAGQLAQQGVIEVNDEDLQNYMEENNIADADMDESAGDVGAVGTTGLAPCVAICMTVMHGTQRYNVIYHASGVASPQAVINEIQGYFDGEKGWPNYDQLANPQYDIVGGNRDSARLQLVLLEYMRDQGIPIRAITLRNAPNQREESNTVVITPDGATYFSVEEG